MSMHNAVMKLLFNLTKTDYVILRKIIHILYVILYNFRYRPSEQINVTVISGEPSIVNFTLTQDTYDDQGNQDAPFVHMLPLPDQYLALYKLVPSYDDMNY